MTEQPPESQPLDRYEERRQRREARRAARRMSGQGAWIVGAILILLGGVFLLQNLGVTGMYFNNWWALFILIPAFGAFERGLHSYREAGNQLTSGARNGFFTGSILLLVTIVFLFNLDWTYVGPIILVVAGVAILASTMLSNKTS
jgi:hypothetical protein